MDNIAFSDTYIVNPVYKFKNDLKRIMLINNDSYFCNTVELELEGKNTTNFGWRIHPIVAYYFSFFNGELNLDDTLKKISQETELHYDEVKNTIIPFIENNEIMIFPLEIGDINIHSIPKRFLIKKQENLPNRDLLKNIDLESIIKDYDGKTARNYIPNEITFMVTSECVTNCIYCYADRKNPLIPLPVNRFIELIREARKLGLRNVGISGGDIFAYKYWYELLQELKENNYGIDDFSTKFPINEETIIKLKELGVRQIQISLDTIDNVIIKKLLKVDDSYLANMKKTLKNMEKHDLKFTVKAVITKYNDSIESINNLLSYLLSLKNFIRISIAPGEYSRFKKFDYKSSVEKLNKIQDFVKSKKLENIPIIFQSYTQPDTDTFEKKMENFHKRALCTGNVHQFWVLPDGKATICEQTYWHPFFILGDLNYQSIMEVWNSEKSLALWNIKQDEIKQESPCHSCTIFEECRRGLGNCWRDAFATYGENNYDFPATNCPYAPPVKIIEDRYFT